MKRLASIPLVLALSPNAFANPANPRVLRELPPKEMRTGNDTRSGYLLKDEQGLRLRFVFNKKRYTEAEKELAKKNQGGWDCESRETRADFRDDECESRITLDGRLSSAAAEAPLAAVVNNELPKNLGQVLSMADGRWYIAFNKETSAILTNMLPQRNFLQNDFVDAENKPLGSVQEIIRTKKIICGYKLPSFDVICKMLILGDWQAQDVLKTIDFSAPRRGGLSGSVVGTSLIVEGDDRASGGESSAEEAEEFNPALMSVDGPTRKPIICADDPVTRRLNCRLRTASDPIETAPGRTPVDLRIQPLNR